MDSTLAIPTPSYWGACNLHAIFLLGLFAAQCDLVTDEGVSKSTAAWLVTKPAHLVQALVIHPLCHVVASVTSVDDTLPSY